MWTYISTSRSIRISLHSVKFSNVGWSLLTGTRVVQGAVMNSELFWTYMPCRYATYTCMISHEHMFVSMIYRVHVSSMLKLAAGARCINDCLHLTRQPHMNTRQYRGTSWLPLCVIDDSFKYVIWLIHTCDMTNLYVMWLIQWPVASMCMCMCLCLCVREI